VSDNESPPSPPPATEVHVDVRTDSAVRERFQTLYQKWAVDKRSPKMGDFLTWLVTLGEKQYPQVRYVPPTMQLDSDGKHVAYESNPFRP
jgi:hypothetical protein